MSDKWTIFSTSPFKIYLLDYCRPTKLAHCITPLHNTSKVCVHKIHKQYKTWMSPICAFSIVNKPSYHAYFAQFSCASYKSKSCSDIKYFFRSMTYWYGRRSPNMPEYIGSLLFNNQSCVKNSPNQSLAVKRRNIESSI